MSRRYSFVPRHRTFEADGERGNLRVLLKLQDLAKKLAEAHALNARLNAEIDALNEAGAVRTVSGPSWRERAETAEAREAAYREALETIISWKDRTGDDRQEVNEMVAVAEGALGHE